MTGDTTQGAHSPRARSAEERRGSVRIIGADRAGGTERPVDAVPGPADADGAAAQGTSEGPQLAAGHLVPAHGSGGFGPEDWADVATAEEPELPHWTEAPTGEVPAVLSRGDHDVDDDPWAALPEPSWREGHADWAQAESIAPPLRPDDARRSDFLAEPDTSERQPWTFELGDDETSALDADIAGDEPRTYDDLDDLDGGELFGAAPSDRARSPEGDVSGSIAGEKTSILRLTAIAAAAARDETDRGPSAEADDGGDEPGPIGFGPGQHELDEPDLDEPDLDGPDLDEPDLDEPGALDEHSAARRAARDVGVGSFSPAPDESAGARHRRKGLRSSVGRRGAPGRPHAERVEPTPRGAKRTPPGTRAAMTAPATLRRGEDAVSQRTGRNITAAIVSGVAIGAIALVAFDFGTVPSMAVVTAVLTLAAMEGLGAFRRAGYRPATLLGLVAVAGLLVATYNKTTEALPAVLVLLVAATFFWHLVGVDRRAEPVRSISATILVFCWVGVLGSFAALLLAPSLFPHRTGIAYLLGALIAAVAYDVGALAAGAWIGKHPLSAVSPGKTWEGVVGGAVVTIAVSAGVVHLIHPWSLREAAALGVIVAVVSPIGDLCESLVKRHLGLKDMGRILPGHGGLLDRVDGLLFVLPATYYLVRAFH